MIVGDIVTQAVNPQEAAATCSAPLDGDVLADAAVNLNTSRSSSSQRLQHFSRRP